MKEQDLHNYQVSAVNHILDHPFCGLFLDMGLGKTVSSLTAIKRLMYEELDIERVLVIAPKRVATSVWSAEITKWDHLKKLKLVKVVGTEKQRKQALATSGDIFIMGRDNVSWLCGQYGGSMLPFDMLVIDESSSFKSPKSLRFKALKAVQPSFNRIVLLTGTPAPNGLIDLWAQIFLLDRGERLGRFISNFRDKYFKPGKRNGAIIYNYNLQKDGERLIHKQIGDICMSMKAEDYLDLPARIDNYIEIELGEKLQEDYEAFERDKILELMDAEEITALNAAALVNKLLQFANGAVYDADKEWHEVHKLKLDALDEIIEAANGQPVLIAWTYRHDMYRIKQRFKARELKTDQDILDWNAGKIPVMMMHPASGGHGLNLQAGGNIIVWFGQTWSLELYQQFNARLDRQGQKKQVVVNHLVAMNTADQNVVKAIKNKSTKQESLMQAIKVLLDKYGKAREKDL